MHVRDKAKRQNKRCMILHHTVVHHLWFWEHIFWQASTEGQGMQVCCTNHIRCKSTLKSRRFRDFFKTYFQQPWVLQDAHGSHFWGIQSLTKLIVDQLLFWVSVEKEKANKTIKKNKETKKKNKKKNHKIIFYKF